MEGSTKSPRLARRRDGPASSWAKIRGASHLSRRAYDLVIVQIGLLPARDPFQKLNLRLNDDGSIAVDQYYETSRPGDFAAGDVHGEIKLIPVSWADGIQAAIYAFDEITRPYWLNEKRLHDPRIDLMEEKIAQAARHVAE